LRARHPLGVIEPVAVRIPQAAAMLGIGRSTLYLCIAAVENIWFFAVRGACAALSAS